MKRSARPALKVLLAAATVLLAGVTAHLVSASRIEPLPVLYTMGGDFTLDSTRGEVLRLADLKGRLVLLNFGYTGCPDVCPTVLARLRAVLIDLDAVDVDVQPLFVTLDPERDDVDTLQRYLMHFHPALIGLRGDPAATAAVARRYDVHVARAAADDSGYQLDHSVHIYLIDARGRVRATFGASVPIADIVATVRRLDAAGLEEVL